MVGVWKRSPEDPQDKFLESDACCSAKSWTRLPNILKNENG